MNMNEKELLNILLKNEDFVNSLKEILLHDNDLAKKLGVGNKNMFVWCVKLETTDGVPYYHPLVVPACNIVPSNTSQPNVADMMSADFYRMIASENQFEAHKYEYLISMFKNMYSYPVMLLTVPESVYEALKESLHNLIVAILAEIEKCFEPMDNIARMTRANADNMKVAMIMNVFSQITAVATCLNEELEAVESDSHEYEIMTRQEESNIVYCPECEEINRRGDEYCCNCGAALNYDDDYDDDYDEDYDECDGEYDDCDDEQSESEANSDNEPHSNSGDNTSTSSFHVYYHTDKGLMVSTATLSDSIIERIVLGEEFDIVMDNGDVVSSKKVISVKK